MLPMLPRSSAESILGGRPVERSTPVERLEAWRRNLPEITTDHDSFAALLDRSTEDLAALRLFDPEHPDRTVVAAGAPWFMTLFGRDSLITSWMSMMVDSDLALGTLQTLARYQGEDVNPVTEEEERVLVQIPGGMEYSGDGYAEVVKSSTLRSTDEIAFDRPGSHVSLVEQQEFGSHR